MSIRHISGPRHLCAAGLFFLVIAGGARMAAAQDATDAPALADPPDLVLPLDPDGTGEDTATLTPCDGCEEPLSETGEPVDIAEVTEEIIEPDVVLQDDPAEGPLLSGADPVVIAYEDGCTDCAAPTMVPEATPVTAVATPRDRDRTRATPVRLPRRNICTEPDLYVTWLCAWQGFERP